MQTILYGDFQFNPRQCGVMQFGEVKQSIAIQCTEVYSCLVQSSLVSFTPVVLPRHQLIFQRTQPTKGYPVIRGWTSNTGISVLELFMRRWSQLQAKLQLQEESKARIQAQVQWNFWVMKVKASQSRSSSSKKKHLWRGDRA